MDPVSALGVASAAIAFVDFGLKTLALCREIRDDVSGTTISNRSAESYSRTVRDLSTELRNGVRGQSAASRRINSIAHELVVISEELLAIVEKVRSAGNANIARIAKTTFRVLKERKTIEKLQVRLEKQQSLLDSALLHDLGTRFTAATLEQTRQLSGLNGRTRDLIQMLQDQQTTSQQRWKNVSSTVATSRAENEAFHRMSLAKNDEVLHAVVDVRRDVQSHMTDMKQLNDHEELLRSLFYPEITARKEMLKPPWERTFDWIFEESDGARRFGRWSSFPRWLREGQDVYWLSGKAGSGKSTLMAHIINEPRTRLLLADWARGHALCTPSYFFWRPGSEEQKSVSGLLRSLLFQLLEEIPALTQKLLTRFPGPKGRVAAWSITKLVQQLQFAIQSSTDHRFCFFIDGLDEFEGDYNDMLDVIAGIQQGNHAKFCFSSRPEVPMVVRLSGFARLRMEDLNYPDIQCYVSETLARHVSDSAVAAILAPGVVRYVKSNGFGETISDKAEGVFLWAALATQSIIRGLQSSDDEATLDARLEEVPTEMATLFKYMLGNVETVHKRSLAYVFQLLQFYHESITWEPLSIEALTTSKLQGDIQSYGEYLAECHRTEHQLEARSRGLLVVSHTNCNVRSDKNWYAPCLNRTSNASQEVLDRLTIVSSRSHLESPDNIVPLLLEQQDRSIDWVHRSAYDFVCHGEGADMFRIHQRSQAEVQLSLLQGCFKRLVALPTMNTWDLVRFAFKATSLEQQCLHRYLDELRELLTHFNLDELADSRWTCMKAVPVDHVPDHLRDCYYRQVPFWTECMVEGLTSYICSRLLVNTPDSETTLILAASICSYCVTIESMGGTLPVARSEPTRTECLSEMLATLSSQVLSDSLEVDKQALRRCESGSVELSFGGGNRTCRFSWSSLVLRGRLGTLAPIVVRALLYASDSWLRVIQDCVQPLTAEHLSVLHAFAALFEKLDVRFAETTTKSGPRVITWIPAAATILWKIRSREDIPEEMVDSLLDCSMGIQLEFRHGSVSDFLAEDGTTNDLATPGPVLYPIRCTLSHWAPDLTNWRETAVLVQRSQRFREELINDIWMNSQGVLSAWHQLYSLACVRSYGDGGL